MTRKQVRTRVVTLLLVAAVSLVFAGCFGGSSGTTKTTKTTRTTSTGVTSTSLSSGTGTTLDAALSTFRSKDPFVQQAVPTTGTTTGEDGGSTGTTSKPGTTIPRPPSTTGGGGSGGSGGATSSTVPGGGSTSSTSTTAPHLHTMKILSVGQVGGAPAVTFQVDGSVYKDRHVGDVASTNWGQIKVLDVNLSSKVVTLLHGSETVVLSVGQVVFQ